MARQVTWGSTAALWVLLAMALMFAVVTAVCVSQPHQPKTQSQMRKSGYSAICYLVNEDLNTKTA